MPTARELKAQAESQLAESAKTKLKAGETPTQRELNALSKLEEQQFIDQGIAFCLACPKRVLTTQCDSHSTSLHRLADDYGIPELRKRDVNLWVVLTKLIRLPGEFRRGRAKPNKIPGELDSLVFEEGDSEWRQKCYEEKYYALRDERLIRQGELLPASVVHDAHTKWAAIWRDAGHKIGVDFGVSAQVIIEQAIEDCERAMEDVLNEWDAKRIDDDVVSGGAEKKREEPPAEGSEEFKTPTDQIPSFLR